MKQVYIVMHSRKNIKLFVAPIVIHLFYLFIHRR